MIDYAAALLDIDFYPRYTIIFSYSHIYPEFTIKIKDNISRTDYYYPVEIDKNWEWREN